jgi:hypothetical protein
MPPAMLSPPGQELRVVHALGHLALLIAPAEHLRLEGPGLVDAARVELGPTAGVRLAHHLRTAIVPWSPTSIEATMTLPPAASAFLTVSAASAAISIDYST